ncbi:DUF3618 domain-containing protein [Geodermatophilus sp. CPCC 206100]|uniref:DUF3618 domain-containing protein n=1 Tax=Geodermatophilus sp. CPCC 206100 TaxID=3020054 RepID=UPI003B0021A7
MSTPSSSSAAGNGAPNDPDAIKAEIEATREQLGRTVDELSHRLDVPARAKEGAFRARDTAVETYKESPPAVIGAGAGVAALLGLLVWRRRTRDSRRAKRAAKREAKALAARRAAAQKAAAKKTAKARKAAAKNAAKTRKAAAKARKSAAKARTSTAKTARTARRTARRTK